MARRSAIATLIDTIYTGVFLKINPLLLLIVIFSAGFFLLRPTVIKLFDAKQQLEDKTKELQTLENRNQQLTKLKEGSSEIQLEEELIKLNTYLPSGKPSLEVLLSLLKLARQQQVQFSGLSLNPGKVKLDDSAPKLKTQNVNLSSDNQKTKKVVGTDSFEINIGVNGSKENLENFVTKLRELAPAMRISFFATSIENANPGNELLADSQSLMSLNLKINVYSRELPKFLPNIQAPFEPLTAEELALLDEMTGYLFQSNSFLTPDLPPDSGEQLRNSNPFVVGQSN